ncbi:hypothetical protein K461DRAFT_156389 [Myriangium duriaei CBS 260.36]|uniref:Uncharacterized protein n=1 Tax=Myriangium duriaei CBS 260.36 TaxID=1168546 RepID=A0A9P4MG42_9PEZI|nr:hypothetical protein K461DRAFT_156389 [Myriangium duriaei CBS 260.36]
MSGRLKLQPGPLSTSGSHGIAVMLPCQHGPRHPFRFLAHGNHRHTADPSWDLAPTLIVSPQEAPLDSYLLPCSARLTSPDSRLYVNVRPWGHATVSPAIGKFNGSSSLYAIWQEVALSPTFRPSVLRYSTVAHPLLTDQPKGRSILLVQPYCEPLLVLPVLI